MGKTKEMFMEEEIVNHEQPTPYILRVSLPKEVMRMARLGMYPDLIIMKREMPVSNPQDYHIIDIDSVECKDKKPVAKIRFIINQVSTTGHGNYIISLGRCLQTWGEIQ